MSTQPILLLITAETCSACVSFKQSCWPTAKRNILQSGRVQLEEINLPSTSSQIPAHYPVDLKRYIGWFPTLILIPRENWERAKRGESIQAQVFNGSFVNGLMTHGRGNAPYPTNPQGIAKWLDDNISSSSSSSSTIWSTQSQTSQWSDNSWSTTQPSSQQRSNLPVFRGIVYRPRSFK